MPRAPTSRRPRRPEATTDEVRVLQPQPYDNLHLYNSLTRRVERFVSREDHKASIYVCGITPYDVGHLGHALVYVAFDTIRRWLEFNAYEVRHVQNITDVDDDMVRVSRRLGLSIKELTDRNHQVYLDEMRELNVLQPDVYPRVSETIPEIIETVQRLVANGFAYEVEGYVFFDVTRTPEFGVLAGLSGQALLEFKSDSMPEEPQHLKRHPLDFLVWQPCTDEGATFPSPWGAGRPGWHIECSAMACRHLGDQIDIHGGGKDLRYPHHDSEIVQSEAASGLKPYAAFWLHNGTMGLDGQKMSKSLGNLVKVSDLLGEGHTGNGIRLSLLAKRWRDDRDFDRGVLAACEETARLLERAALAPGGPADQLRVQPYRVAFQTAMDDDLDTPKAIEVLRDLAQALLAGRVSGETGAPALVEMADVMGIVLRGE
ncbi:MAG: cysteine--tRNA ligase [Dehalococcoidia bacterium]|nr:MAG: cysteine--tRNA ligase [Dehalococcoidia bacterium]